MSYRWIPLALFGVVSTPDLLIAQGPPRPPRPPVYWHQLQFNELRGDRIHDGNYVDWVASHPDWRVDAGRPGFQAAPGTGALGNGAYATAVHTNPFVRTSICWWQRQRVPLPAGQSGEFAQVFGGAPHAPREAARCFTGGDAGDRLVYRGGSSFEIQSWFSVGGAPGIWQHVAIVIGETSARFYLDGDPGPVVQTYPAGSHDFANADMWIGSGPTSQVPYTTFFDIDDFQVFAGELGSRDLTRILRGERALNLSIGPGCPSSRGVPRIYGYRSPDATAGTPDYAIELFGLEPDLQCALLLGFDPLSLPGPIDLRPFLGAAYSGCLLQTDIAISHTDAADSLGRARFPIPIPGGGVVSGLHLYAQGLSLGSPSGGMSGLLDVNMQ